MNAAELLVKCLETEGVEYVFGLPGEENARVMLALEDSPIEFVLTRHEQGAAFMADVYGRLTGTPAVCLGTLGPGAANLVTGVANANMDHSPVVVITGQADSRRLHKESHQAMHVVEMFGPITKWSTQIINEYNIPETVRKAFRIARTEKPGATHIELSEDIAGRVVDAEPMIPIRFRRPAPNAELITETARLLREAKAPIILAGNGAIRRRASAELRRFTSLTGIPVISTFMGKGSVARSDENCLFTIGLQARDHTACAVNYADVVITLGYDLVEYPPRLWNAGRAKTVVHMDFLPAEIDADYHPEIEIVADLANTLALLSDEIGDDRLHYDLAYYKQVRAWMLAEFAEYADDDAEGVIRPQKAIHDVREILEPDDILLSDVGAHKLWVGRYYQCDEPNTCLIPNGFCSMGFALPGAIAAKMVHPEKRVLALCGDGGFLMNVQELETAKRLGTNFVALIWEDGAYGLISWKQDTKFGRHSNLAFGNPDFVKLAESFGCRGMRCERSRDLKQVLEEAFACDVPCIVTIPIDYRENPILTERLGEIACAI